MKLNTQVYLNQDSVHGKFCDATLLVVTFADIPPIIAGVMGLHERGQCNITG